MLVNVLILLSCGALAWVEGRNVAWQLNGILEPLEHEDFVNLDVKEAFAGLFDGRHEVLESFSSGENYVIPPDTGLNVKQFIEKYGYPFENHTVVTKDGYILEVHRIPHGRNGSSSTLGAPVLIMPGVLCGSDTWVNMGPEKSLGFILSNHGYDVWLANYRGTRWSRKHRFLNPDKYLHKERYWTYSFQQIGEYDVPDIIDYILEQTKHEKLFYIGHSQGTTSFMALTSESTQYNEKIRLATLLSPIAYFGHMTSPFFHLLHVLRDKIDPFLKITRQYEIFSHIEHQSDLAVLLCSDGSKLQQLCADVFLLSLGYTPDQLNKTMLPVILTTAPVGASMRQFQHYAQLFNTGKFQKYDYGEKQNLKKYGQATPPQYDLGKVTAPIAVFSGDSDPLCNVKDVERTSQELKNVVLYKLIKGFNHADVMWGIDVVEFIYRDMLELMKKY